MNLIQLTPAGLFELMRIKGLGGKKLSIIWHALKIDTMEGLLKACQKNKLSKIPGFGIKTESNIITAIESYTSHKDHFRYAAVADVAEQLVVQLTENRKNKVGQSLWRHHGDVPQRSPRIEILSAKKFIPSYAEKIYGRSIIIKEPGKRYHALKKYLSLFIILLNIISFQNCSEEQDMKIMSKKYCHELKESCPLLRKKRFMQKLNYLSSFLKCGKIHAEWNFNSKPEDLVTLEDIKGVVHNHTTYSDGVDTLENFVQACIDKGFEYTVISDHSKNAHYAGGLKEEKVLRQFKEINALNKVVKPFRIFKSIECDIRVSGELGF